MPPKGRKPGPKGKRATANGAIRTKQLKRAATDAKKRENVTESEAGTSSSDDSDSSSTDDSTSSSEWSDSSDDRPKKRGRKPAGKKKPAAKQKKSAAPTRGKTSKLPAKRKKKEETSSSDDESNDDDDSSSFDDSEDDDDDTPRKKKAPTRKPRPAARSAIAGTLNARASGTVENLNARAADIRSKDDCLLKTNSLDVASFVNAAALLFNRQKPSLPAATEEIDITASCQYFMFVEEGKNSDDGTSRKSADGNVRAIVVLALSTDGHLTLGRNVTQDENPPSSAPSTKKHRLLVVDVRSALEFQEKQLVERKQDQSMTNNISGKNGGKSGVNGVGKSTTKKLKMPETWGAISAQTTATFTQKIVEAQLPSLVSTCFTSLQQSDVSASATNSNVDAVTSLPAMALPAPVSAMCMCNFGANVDTQTLETASLLPKIEPVGLVLGTAPLSGSIVWTVVPSTSSLKLLSCTDELGLLSSEISMGGGISPTCIVHLPYYNGCFGRSSMATAAAPNIVPEGDDSKVGEGDGCEIVQSADGTWRRMKLYSTYFAVGTVNHGVLIYNVSFRMSFTLPLDNTIPLLSTSGTVETEPVFTPIGSLPTAGVAGTKQFICVHLTCYSSFNESVATAYRDQGMRLPLMLGATGFEQPITLLADLHSPSSLPLGFSSGRGGLDRCLLATSPDNILKCEGRVSENVRISEVSRLLGSGKLARAQNEALFTNDGDGYPLCTSKDAMSVKLTPTGSMKDFFLVGTKKHFVIPVVKKTVAFTRLQGWKFDTVCATMAVLRRVRRSTTQSAATDAAVDINDNDTMPAGTGSQENGAAAHEKEDLPSSLVNAGILNIDSSIDGKDVIATVVSHRCMLHSLRFEHGAKSAEKAINEKEVFTQPKRKGGPLGRPPKLNAKGERINPKGETSNAASPTTAGPVAEFVPAATEDVHSEDELLLGKP